MPSDDTLPSPGQPAGWTGFQTKLETIHGSGADMQLRSLLDRNQYHDPEGDACRAGIPDSAWSLFGLFVVIIGSDVLYDRGQPELLSRFIDRHSGASVEVLIVDPSRGNQAPHDGPGLFACAVARLVASGRQRLQGHLHRYCRGPLTDLTH